MTRVTAIGALMSCFLSAASAQDAQRLAAPGAIFPGTHGRGVTKEALPLAGLPRDYIASQMRALRDGQRQATVMHQIAKGYTDAQIDALAAWFSAQKR